MKDKKIYIGIGIGVAVIIVIGIIVFFATSNTRQEGKIKEEIEKISKIDITKDNVDMNIKTTGDYGVIEKTIKEYMNNYSTNIKELQSIIQDGKMQEILTTENYKNDAPEFTESLKYINETKTKFNQIIDTLINMTNENAIIKEIQKENLKEEFVNMYKELMFGDGMTVELNNSIDVLKQTSKLMNNIFDTEEKIINMLKENITEWEINEENIIKFNNESLLNKYNEYIKEISATSTENITIEEPNSEQ